MKTGDTVAAILGCIAISLTAMPFGSGPSNAAAVATEAPDVEASTALIREIQSRTDRRYCRAADLERSPQIRGKIRSTDLSADHRQQDLRRLPGAVTRRSIQGHSRRRKTAGGFSGGCNTLPGRGGAGPASRSTARPICRMHLQPRRFPNRHDRVYAGQISASGI